MKQWWDELPPLPPELEKFIDDHDCCNDPPRNSNGNGIYQSRNSNGRANGKAGTEHLKLRFFDELKTPQAKLWHVKNVIAQSETSSWIGAPGSGKSCLITDIAVHLAAHLNWRGRKVRQGACLYFALEKALLVERRLMAYRLCQQRDDLPIAIAGQIIDLMNRGCVDSISDAIKRVEEHFYTEVSLLVFDTWSKGIAAGGGDENHARDQNIAAANLRRVIDQRSYLHIATIGHTGKDEAKGERGSNAKLADVDLEVRLSGEDVKTATITKANDQELGELTSFKLEPFEFGPDEDGDPFRTFIVSPDLMTGEGTSRQRLSDRQKLALRALENCRAEQRQPWVGTSQVVQAVALSVWRAELYATGVLDSDASSPREDFRRLFSQLLARNLIGTRDDFVWRAAPG